MENLTLIRGFILWQIVGFGFLLAVNFNAYLYDSIDIYSYCFYSGAGLGLILSSLVNIFAVCLSVKFSKNKLPQNELCQNKVLQNEPPPFTEKV